jgi:exodeoxyribonuclease VII small subunit
VTADGRLGKLKDGPQLIDGELITLESEQEPAPRRVGESGHLTEKGYRGQSINPFIRIEGYNRPTVLSTVVSTGASSVASDLSYVTDQTRMPFEASLKRLEEIVAALEGEQAGLDASLKLFEEGVELLRSASNDLNVAESKVKLLVERADGAFELRETDL